MTAGPVGPESARRIATIYGARGTAWVERLPMTLRELADTWQLTHIGEPFAGVRTAFVAPVTDRGGRALVLKVSSDLDSARFEHEALAHWNGSGAVRVLGFEPNLGAILEERLTPGSSLKDADLNGPEAVDVFVDVVTALRASESVAAGLPAFSYWLKPLDLPQSPAPSPSLELHIRQARAVTETLLGIPSKQRVLHGDLHHSNILRGHGGWLAVDPKPVVGPEEAEAAAFLRNLRCQVIGLADPLEVLTSRTLAIATRLDFDPVRVAGWAFVMGVIAAVWAQEDREGEGEVEKWLRCAAVLRQTYDRVRTG